MKDASELKPGKVLSEFLKLPEYVFVYYEKEFREALIELYERDTQRQINIVRDPEDEFKDSIDYVFASDNIFTVFQQESMIQLHITEVIISICELDSNFNDFPSLKNELANKIAHHLWNIYSRLKSMNLYKNGQLMYDFYEEYQIGFLLKRK